jgi:hypothetical protein
MELRTFNVQRVYFYCVKCTIGDSIGVNHLKIEENRENIKSMVAQLPKNQPLNKCHIREDGEQWTPYVQVVMMLVLLGIHIGVLKGVTPLLETTIIEHV